MNMRGMERVSTVVILGIALAATIALPLAHLYPVSTRDYDPLFERRVCAFYYTWYGNQTSYPGENPGTAGLMLHWDESHPNYDPPIVHHPTPENPWDIASAQHPSLNTSDVTLFDSGDPRAIKFHLDMANYSGIDTLICTWWGQNGYEDYNFRQLLNVTQTHGYDMQHTLYFETVQGKYNDTNPSGVSNIVADMKYIIDNYGDHPNFLKVDDRPVIFVYATFSRPSPQNWTQAITQLNNDGYHPFLIADIGGAKAVPQDYLSRFDGIHVYNPHGIYVHEPENALYNFEQLVLSTRFAGKLACATVLPGYNDTQVRHNVPVLQRRGGNLYKESWNVAIGANPDWVLVCTFNEWHEGTEIEPSIENGSFYVDLTRHYTGLFRV